MGRQGVAGGEMRLPVGQVSWAAIGGRIGKRMQAKGLLHRMGRTSVTRLWPLVFSLGLTPLHAAGPYLFAYFIEPAKTGVYFALSQDGYHYTPLNDGKPWLPPSHEGELMRDAFLTRGPDKEFHMVWTWDWHTDKIGYAHSRDLIHWSEQIEVPLMAKVEGARNTWAPEIYWDDKPSAWLIVWSSVVEGKHKGNRIYHSYTKDFVSFTPPEIFFDPGYEVIDATILHARGQYWLVFKDERPEPLHKEIEIARGPCVEGPWTNIQGPFTEAWSEGPSALEIDGKFVIYYDHYHVPPVRYEAIGSSDLEHWEPINDQVTFPQGVQARELFEADRGGSGAVEPKVRGSLRKSAIHRLKPVPPLLVACQLWWHRL
jgi:hypothetical protein